MVTQKPYTPPAAPATTTTTTTSTTTVCSGGVVSNAVTLAAFKGRGIGIPAFTFTTNGNAKVRPGGFRIKSLPSVGDGILYLGNAVVADEQLISVKDNGKLVYVPKVDADAQATFTYITETSCGNSAEATVTINVTAAPVDDDCDCASSSTTTTTI